MRRRYIAFNNSKIPDGCTGYQKYAMHTFGSPCSELF
jgi:hypothetical protein